jgi:NNP family nitrate/nitrite transporter-like MFS transporter
MMLIIAYLYNKYTKDTPKAIMMRLAIQKQHLQNRLVCTGRLAHLGPNLAYAMCFGMELTFDNVASLHFVDTFHLSQSSAGFWAGIFGFMNLFARALGGIASDKVGKKFGMRGKGLLLAGVLLLEGCGLILFAKSGSLPGGHYVYVNLCLFLKMSNGATYGIVPFVNAKNVGLVSGIVGAGGNLGGMLFGFLFKSSTITYVEAFTYIGYTCNCSFCNCIYNPVSKTSRIQTSSRKKQAGHCACKH